MLIKILTIIGFFAAFILAQIKFMHFFQLNSYSASAQMRWMDKNIEKWITYPIIFIIALTGFIFKPAAFIMPLSLFGGAYLARPKKAKKPLVYTKRVQRMFLTEVFLIAAVIIIASFFGMRVVIFSILILYFFAPVFAVTANFINKPVERAVNKHFINEAKRILKSAPDLEIIGITGSYGKTSVKYYLNTLLRAKYNVLMTPESYNTPMGVVMTIRKSLKATHDIFICEMGAKKVGEIKEICDIVHPKHGIITSIGPQHLETFKSLENVKRTKFELCSALPEEGILFINGDDENVTGYNRRKNAVTYSMKNGDYTASDIVTTEKGTSFNIKTPEGETGSFSTKLIGTHNVLNITGAIAAAHTLGVSLLELKPQVRKLECVPHRLQLIDKGNAVVIDDAYNSNPSGTKAALDTLSLITGYKILVTPGMVELGEKQYECNYEFGKNAAKVCDFVILVGKKQTQSIQNGLKDSGYPQEKMFVAATIGEALSKAYSVSTNGEKRLILLENDLPDNY